MSNTNTKENWLTKQDEADRANKDWVKARDAYMKAIDHAGATDLAAKEARLAWFESFEAQEELRVLQS